MKNKSQLIVALDVDTWPKAKKLVDTLYPAVKIFKVGSQLFTGFGPKAIDYINKKGGRVFLDLKFYDIPNTVASAVRQAVRLNVMMMTLHISGGRDMLLKAKEAAIDEAKKLKKKCPLLVGVTILTSQSSSPDEVFKLAELGLNSNIDGVVCSVQEAAFLRKIIKKDFVIVTPGIRPNGASLDDQKRVATVEEAVKNGSDFLVVGRPIVAAEDPLGAAKKIVKSLG